MFFDTTKGAKCDPYAPFWFADSAGCRDWVPPRWVCSLRFQVRRLPVPHALRDYWLSGASSVHLTCEVSVHRSRSRARRP